MVANMQNKCRNKMHDLFNRAILMVDSLAILLLDMLVSWKPLLTFPLISVDWLFLEVGDIGESGAGRLICLAGLGLLGAAWEYVQIIVESRFILSLNDAWLVYLLGPVGSRALVMRGANVTIHVCLWWVSTRCVWVYACIIEPRVSLEIVWTHFGWRFKLILAHLLVVMRPLMCW